MANITLEKKDGKLYLQGDLTFDSGPSIIDKPLFNGESSLSIDLAGVTHSDSAGLALLIQWFRQAKKEAKKVEFLHVPAKMQALAKVSNLDKVLPFVSH